MQAARARFPGNFLAPTATNYVKGCEPYLDALISSELSVREIYWSVLLLIRRAKILFLLAYSTLRLRSASPIALNISNIFNTMPLAGHEIDFDLEIQPLPIRFGLNRRPRVLRFANLRVPFQWVRRALLFCK